MSLKSIEPLSALSTYQQVVEVYVRVVPKLATDDRVVTPLDLDEVSDALAPIFSGDFKGIVSRASV